MTRTAFITGGSSGIGRAIVSKMTQNNWEVITPTHKQLDLADMHEVDKYINDPSFSTKRISALVHVAGIWHDNESVLADMQYGDFSANQITATMNVGLNSFMLIVNKLLSREKTPPSHIIGVSGTFMSGAGWLPYYTSKRALEDFLVGLAQDREDIKVYGISPADTATPAYKKFYPQYAKEAQSPDKIAKLVFDLCYDRTNNNSGSIIELRDGIPRQSGFHV